MPKENENSPRWDRNCIVKPEIRQRDEKQIDRRSESDDKPMRNVTLKRMLNNVEIVKWKQC